MQQELIEMLEEIIQYVEVWKSQDQEVIDKAEALIKNAKNTTAVPQGEPVACLVRQRTLRTRAAIAHDRQDHFSEWSDWYPATLKYGTAVTDPRRNSGPEHLFEMLPLFLAATPAPAPAQEPETALQKFTRFKVAETEGNPVEMLRAFCAFAMNSQDWFDVEPFFDLVREAMASRTAVAPAQEVATLSLAAEDVHAAFTKNFPKSRISQAWINFAADIAQAIAARAAKPAQEVRLTDEEIDRVVLEAVGFEGYGCQAMNKADMRGVSRAIIAALRANENKL